jgi:hypothetical protein
VISTEEGAHALLLCADGGVIYYSASAGATGLSTPTAPDGDASAAAAASPLAGEGGEFDSALLVELPALFRAKELQQLGSWAVQRVGREGHVVSGAEGEKRDEGLRCAAAFKIRQDCCPCPHPPSACPATVL